MFKSTLLFTAGLVMAITGYAAVIHAIPVALAVGVCIAVIFVTYEAL